MRKRIFIAISLVSTVLTGCWNDAEFIDVIKLGWNDGGVSLDGGLEADEKRYAIETSDYGTGSFDVISNVDYDLIQISGADWLTVEEATADIVRFSYPANNGFKRSSRIVLSYGPRTDTLRITQPGKWDIALRLSSDEMAVPATGGEYAVDVLTNMQQRDLRVEVSDVKALPDVKLSDNVLSFRVPETKNRDTKTYYVTVYVIDGWGERVEAVLKVIQAAG